VKLKLVRFIKPLQLPNPIPSMGSALATAKYKDLSLEWDGAQGVVRIKRGGASAMVPAAQIVFMIEKTSEVSLGSHEPPREDTATAVARVHPPTPRKDPEAVEATKEADRMKRSGGTHGSKRKTSKRKGS
jgi:hypothetical protein